MTATPATAPAVEATGVDKRFGSTVALDDVGIRVDRGEVHALVGRNGAGKSTLVSILTGMRTPDRGSVTFFGEPAPPAHDRAAWQRRVACVYQRSTAVPHLSVAENLFLNRQSRGVAPIRWSALRARAASLLEQYGVAVRPDAAVADLTVEQRQLVEIARALSVGARFIILDEPTAQLDAPAISRLFDRMRALQDDGITFLFISHHLHEVYEVCQSVTVYRDARHVVTSSVDRMSRADLVEAMTGEQGGLVVPGADGRDVREDAPVVLSVRGLSGDGFADVDLDLRRGEVVGLAGNASSGKHELAETVYGLRAPTSGEVAVDGKVVRPGDVRAALEHGIGCVPRDRHHQGLVLDLSIAENAALTVLDRLGPAGLIPAKELNRLGARAIRDYDVRAQGPRQPVADLSGGNQQKVVMARALATAPSVLVLINPTAGVDVKSKESLLGVVDAEARNGSAVVVVSDELDDLKVCDRVLVMFHGRVVADVPRGWTDQELVGAVEGISNR
ncbi:MAG: sugar ABC transporter ATP-binding protein [Saccharothrix sp.]|nr:sugar ABC transporter ATP-binding protein [Saccharothrix sp.]